MPRVCVVALAAVALSVCAASSPVRAQKGKPAPPPIAVTATFVDLAEGLTPSQRLEDAIQPGCTFDGTIAADTGHFTTSASASECAAVAFGPAAFDEVSGSPLQPSTYGIAASFFVRNVGKAPLPGGGAIAGQFGVSWTGESADGVLRAYALQFGDAFDASIDYARTTCVEAADGLCTAWAVTSLRGIAPTGDLTQRETGPLGRLSVTTGRGSRGTQVLASQLEVPYTIRIVRQP